MQLKLCSTSRKRLVENLILSWSTITICLAVSSYSLGQESDPFGSDLRRQAEEQLANLESKREFFKQHNIPFPTIEDIMKENQEWNDEIEQKGRLENLREKNRNILKHLSLLMKGSEHFASIALSPKQREELQSLHDRNHRQFAELFGKELAGDQLDFDQLRASEKWKQVDSETAARVLQFENDLRDEVLQVMLPFQLETLENTRLNAGLPRMLIESPIGNQLELTEEQRRKIKRNSDDLADDIEKFVNEARQRAFDLVAKELTAEQMTKLTESYNRDSINRMYAMATLNLLYAQHKMTMPEQQIKNGKSVFQSAFEQAYFTKLNDEAWKQK